MQEPLLQGLEPKLHTDFDYIIVGAGTSGCALAGSLSRKAPRARIALVEYGGDVISHPTISAPGRWPASLSVSKYDYKFMTESQPSLAQRQIMYPRGKGLGGTNLINVMLYSRGFRSDWDQMPQGWQSEAIEPVFEALEAKLHLSEIQAGSFGEDVAATAQSLGFQRRQRSFWAEPGVTTEFHATVDSRSGRRLDLYRALGADAENVVLLRGRAHRVLVDSDMCCFGVLLCDGRRLKVSSGRGEVVLCTGAVESPKILQLSGIGPTSLLKQHGIDQVKALPVGEGLKDHPLLAFPCISTSRPSTAELSPNSVQGWVHDVDSGIQLVMIDGQAAPDIIPLGMLAPLQRPGLFWSTMLFFTRLVAGFLGFLLVRCACIRRQAYRVVGINVCLVKPTSTGRVFIKSADAAVDPVVDPQFLSTEEDRKNMHAGISRVRALFKCAPMKARIAADLSFGESRDHLYAAYNTSSYWHPTGTCRMGDCVDAELRVFGIEGLRVADASVLPVHPRAGPMPACMVVGARCADLLVGARQALAA